MQSSLIARYSSLNFVPDPVGDLLFTGIAQDAFKQNVAYAAQSDASYKLGDAHTVRAGLFLQTDHSISQTSSSIFYLNAMGQQTNQAGQPTDMPLDHRRQPLRDRMAGERVSAGRMEAPA